MGFFFKVWINGWGGWGIMGKVIEIIFIVFILFIESFPYTLIPPFLFPLPVFCRLFMDNNGKVGPKDSLPTYVLF